MSLVVPLPSGKTHLKVLIAEDNTATRLLMTALVQRLGYRTVQAKDGSEAVAVFGAEQPDIVLMDIVMPGMNGTDAMPRMRELAGARSVQIIFVTADVTIDSQVRLLALGADDYLVKPVHAELLRVKLDVASRVILQQSEIAENNRELRKYRESSEEELGVVKHMMSRMNQEERLFDEMLDYWILPAANLSGDMVAAARTPRGVLHALLADGTGHGLAAALNVLPIAPIFYSMTANGMSIDSIAASMNKTIKHQLPTGRFVAATLISVDYAARRVRIFNGGNPPLLVIDDAGNVIARFAPLNMALGILPESAFSPQIDEFNYAVPCQLFACSDGVVENLDNAGTTNGEAVITSMMRCAAPDARMDAMRSLLGACDSERPAHDDMTLLFVRCDGKAPVSSVPDRTVAPTSVAPVPAWKFEITLTPDELKELDIVSSLLGFISTLPAAWRQRQEIGVVLSELFNNALDHGVLGLASSLKDGCDGIERWDEMRAAALRDLREGSIAICIESASEGGLPVLNISFLDSGAGFDVAAIVGAADPRIGRPHGRGIALLRAMCKRVDYQGCGNGVSVCFVLAPPADAIPLAA